MPSLSETKLQSLGIDNEINVFFPIYPYDY